MEKQFKYSEIFANTIQGEGHYTGRPTAWIRFWGCNLECNGFGQANPRDPGTYDLSYQSVDISNIRRMEDLPVFSTGCDSSYSWARKFSHLAHTGTAAEIVQRIQAAISSESNPAGYFNHPRSRQDTHMAFTGGEPMMSQTGVTEIMKEFQRVGNLPWHVTIETNGTQRIRDPFREYFEKFEGELFWSVSPKLGSSGEPMTETINPAVVRSYHDLSADGQLKFVCDLEDQTWREVETAVDQYRDAGVLWPVWIMPVGATEESQKAVAAAVAERAIGLGYNVAVRAHAYLFSNLIGK